MNRAAVKRKCDNELVVSRTFNAPARVVFAEALPEQFAQLDALLAGGS